MKKVAVILSGCGYQDGSEITESVSTLIALSEAQARVEIFAPRKAFQSVGHLSGTETGARDVLEEAARLARGQIQALEQLQAQKFDALVFPGGSGVIQVFCDWEDFGAKCTVDPLIKSLIVSFHQESKPIAAFCVAPVLLARVLGENEVTLTVGNDAKTIAEIEKTGALHEICAVDDFITDRHNKLITAPAYMQEEATPAQVFKGIRAALRELMEMA
jgi:enhancing lycopene biosynthesis protein 2